MRRQREKEKAEEQLQNKRYRENSVEIIISTEVQKEESGREKEVSNKEFKDKG